MAVIEFKAKKTSPPREIRGEAKILFFTGVRYERLEPNTRRTPPPTGGPAGRRRKTG